MTLKTPALVALLAAMSLSLGAVGGLAVFASPAAPVPVAFSPVEAADAPEVAAIVASDAGVTIDAGVATGIGTSPIVIPDPIEDPSAFGGVALDAARSGKLALLAILLLLGLSRAAVWASAKWPDKLGWLGGAARPWIVAAAGALATLATSVATLGRVDMTAVAGAIAAAIALELKSTPPAAKVAPGSLGGGK
jgi:hypothetical protein